jgi:hypothetical protein
MDGTGLHRAISTGVTGDSAILRCRRFMHSSMRPVAAHFFSLRMTHAAARRTHAGGSCEAWAFVSCRSYTL